MKFIKKKYLQYKEIINYIIVGGLTTVVSLVSKYILLFTLLDASNALELQIAVIISWICAVSFSYFLNRIFVFNSQSKNYFYEISTFFGGRVLTLLMEMVIMWFFVNLLKLNTNIWIIIITIICQVLIMIGNYIISKFFVFNRK